MEAVYDEIGELEQDIYAKDGVVRLPGFFGWSAVLGIREAASEQIDYRANAPYKSGRRVQMVGDNPGILFWPALDNLTLDDLRYSLEPIVKAFVGDNARQLNNQIYFRHAGDGDAFAWHQDAMFRRGMVEGWDVATYLQTIIVVDEMDQESGGIGFILGSNKGAIYDLVDKEHLRTQSEPPIIFEDPEAERPLSVKWLEAEPGDVIVWNALTVHGSGPNKSSHSRMTYMNGFAPADQCEAWPDFLRDGKLVADLDPDKIPYT